MSTAVFWFRRDLRLNDNHGLFKALLENDAVIPIFIFDPEILEKLPKNDARVKFIFDSLQKLNLELVKINKQIHVLNGKPKLIFQELLQQHTITSVYTNKDYEPYALERDQEVKSFLEQQNISFLAFKDQVIFEENEIVKDDGKPYLVYTPFKNKWKSVFRKTSLQFYQSEALLNKLKLTELTSIKSLEDIGFESSHIKVIAANTSPALIADYEETRNFPALKNGTSKLGPHLRFGTVSIRKMVEKAIAQKMKFFGVS